MLVVGSKAMVQVLYNAGVIDVHQLNNAGMMDLMYAVQNSVGEDLARLLVGGYGIDVHTKSSMAGQLLLCRK